MQSAVHRRRASWVLAMFTSPAVGVTADESHPLVQEAFSINLRSGVRTQSQPHWLRLYPSKRHSEMRTGMATLRPFCAST